MKSHAPKIAAIVLAAGTSGRMGRPKPLLPFGDRPMIARVIESIIAGGLSSIFVVTGHEAAAVSAAIASYNVTPIHNAAYAAGEMLSSIRTGIAALDKKNEAFLLVLGDQPAVGPDTIRTLVNFWTSDTALIIPTHLSKRGHPLLISAALIPEINSIPPTGTLRDVVHRHLDEAAQIEVDDPAVIADVDTPADYQRALADWKKSNA